MQQIERDFRVRRLMIPAVIFAGGIAIASTCGRASAAAPAAQAGQTAQTTRTAPGAPGGGVDGLIAHLHAELKITPDQEQLFKRVADVMRENADTMSALARKRAEDSRNMTAMDDLRSYAEISAAHAEGSKRMIAVFQALYDNMSDAQKKAADEEFREHYASRHRAKP